VNAKRSLKTGREETFSVMEGRGRDYTNEIAELSQDLEEEQVLMLS
jgi:hypothetical protein